MSELTDLPNIGDTLAQKLQLAEINSFDDLTAIGSIEAVMRIKEEDLSTCYNMLYALEGAIRGMRWHGIPKEERARLKAEFDSVRDVG